MKKGKKYDSPFWRKHYEEHREKIKKKHKKDREWRKKQKKGMKEYWDAHPEKRKKKISRQVKKAKSQDEMIRVPSKYGINMQECTQVNKDNFLKEFRRNRGLLAISCSNFDVSPQTIKKWARQDSDFKYKLQLIEELQIDAVESKLFDKILEGDTKAITFFLRQRGGNRGYGDKVDISIDEKREIEEVRNTIEVMDENDRKKLLEISEKFNMNE